MEKEKIIRGCDWAGKDCSGQGVHNIGRQSNWQHAWICGNCWAEYKQVVTEANRGRNRAEYLHALRSG